MKNNSELTPKQDHRVIAKDFFEKGKNLEAWQLGWQVDHKMETKSSVSRKIFETYVDELGMNMVFYYLGDGNFYGIHSEQCPTPVFRFKKDLSEPFVYDQLGYSDTHNYEEEEILYMVPCDLKIWDVVKIDGKSLEEVLQNSYIVNIN